ncbi:F-actin-monooxygenase Mical [Anopheles cruzii]|uniref:F-actin-monooxygenase Mical n=1 Tax=Anopheles cruzii TaxID=68878 RepID=UPI0022EC3581|nr:F-actin-monooxygenase Mical [Anopheles cruzii]
MNATAAAAAAAAAMCEHEKAALATEMFNHFCAATTMRQILGVYRNMCDTIAIRPGPLNEFYPKLRAIVRSWKAQALWKKFDARAAHKVYSKGTAAAGTRVLIVGAGPCGLRTAIEAQLLGAKVVIVEKRDRISRNNVLHLWPFLITDLKALGAKKFYGKFCAGSIDHISIRQLQCILLKVALLLGVEVHEGVSFVREIEPSDGYGWRAAVSPEDHAVSHYEFDVLVGADGKRNTLEGFRRKEFRGKLAIAITANFINKKTEAEAMVEEISGVAFIFNQSFFKELSEKTGIDLENIVYYKDETHYFVMTAMKHSLLRKGVILQDYGDPADLLAPANVDKAKLFEYARDAANFSTKYRMPNLEFAVNHYGNPDVAMFDFTSMFAADNSCKVTVRKNYRLLSCLVGDSLLEPFWPTGSGCARGFLSSMDAAFAVKMFANAKNSLLGTIAQRESVYRLLAQTTPENLLRNMSAYTLDPSTRYRELNKSAVGIAQIKHLLDTDDPALLEQTFLDTNVFAAAAAAAAAAATAAVPGIVEVQPKRKRRTVDTVPLGTVLLRWLKAQLKDSGFAHELTEPAECFTNGKVLCTLIYRYRPDLVNLDELADFGADVCNEHAFMIFENQLGIPRVMSGQESVSLAGVDPKVWLNYLEQICEVFRGEIPHVKHPKLDLAEFRQKLPADTLAWQRMARFATVRAPTSVPLGSGAVAALAAPSGTVAATAASSRKPNYYHPTAEEERFKRGRAAVASPQTDTIKRAKKRRSHEKSGGGGGGSNIEERTRRLQDIEANRVDRQTKRRMQRAQQTQNFYKSIHMLQANTLLRESGDNSGAFEDYSLFLYRQSAPEFNDRVRELELKLRYPDRERGLAAPYARGGINDGDQFSDRVRSMEQRIGGKAGGLVADKKPKDLLRAIGKIDCNDWNVKEIERKIEQSKKTTDIGKSRERVPNWNREQFLARQNRLTQPKDDEKYREIDTSLKAIAKQLKEGHNLDLGERGKNKVASIAGALQSTKQQQKQQQQQQQHQQQQQSNQAQKTAAALVLTASGIAEKCHFCKQRVYLMGKVTTEGLTLHRSCLKCHHCHTNLRLGAYAFDRDDPEGRFYCTHHFKLPSKREAKGSGTTRESPSRARPRDSVAGGGGRRDLVVGAVAPATPTTPDGGASMVDYLVRVDTPERIEFANADDGGGLSDADAHLVIDENEWTDRNFGTESDEESDEDEDLSSTDDSDTGSDSDYEEAAGSPLGAQTLQLASEWISDKRFSNMVDSDDDFYGYSSEDDDADSQTEGEELARAREMRMQEVKLMPPLTLPTDTETEGASDSSKSSSEEVNSATEISTDSEFDHEPNHRVPPRIFIDDTYSRKPAKVQVKQTVIDDTGARYRRHLPALQSRGDQQRTGSELPDQYHHHQHHHHHHHHHHDVKLEFKPLVEVDPTIKLAQSRTAPLTVPRPGDYGLSKTASTEGIASKKSLELKKKYLLGEGAPGLGILKSGSASALDSKFKSFHSNITECQKLLNAPTPAETSPQSLLKSVATVAPTTTTVAQEHQLPPSTPLAAGFKQHQQHEKENVYAGKTSANAAVGSGGALAASKRASLVETINATLVENKLNELKSNEALPAMLVKQQQPNGGVQQPRLAAKETVQPPATPTATTNNNNNNRINNNHNHCVDNSNNNNNNNNNVVVTDTIDLVALELKSGVEPEVEVDGGGAGTREGGRLLEKVRGGVGVGSELKFIAGMKHAYIDLTTDSPNCDRSLVETTLDFSMSPAHHADDASEQQQRKVVPVPVPPELTGSLQIDKNENKIKRHPGVVVPVAAAAAAAAAGAAMDVPVNQDEPVLVQDSPQQQQQQHQQSEDGCHETTLQVPDMHWSKKMMPDGDGEGEEEEEHEERGANESDSLSGSGSATGASSTNSNSTSSSSSSSSSNSTSSVEDIPHFILDSTTSPETQHEERFVPRLEVRDATGELMQIDSLMIIDGRYIGDPEDLKLMEQLPPDTQIAAQLLQEEINQDSISTVMEWTAAVRAARVDKEPAIHERGHETPPTSLDGRNGGGGEDGAGVTADETRNSPARTLPPAEATIVPTKRHLRFDTKNENKIDTLMSMPFVLEGAAVASNRGLPGGGAGGVQKPQYLNLCVHQKPQPQQPDDIDAERTPVAAEPSKPLPVVDANGGGPTVAAGLLVGRPRCADSDSEETEVTTQALTETELSDWTADDAVSENFVDVEFTLTAAGRGRSAIRRNRERTAAQQSRKKREADDTGTGTGLGVRPVPHHHHQTALLSATEDGIIRNLALDDIEFMDTGSEEESCIEAYSTTNRTMLRNRGYAELLEPASVEPRRTHRCQPVPPLVVSALRPPFHYDAGAKPQLVEAINKQIACRVVEYIEQGAYLLAVDDAKTPVNEEPPERTGGLVGTGGDLEEDSLLIITSSQTTAAGTSTTTTATEESDAVTIVAADSAALLPGERAGNSGRSSVTSFSSSSLGGGTAANRTGKDRQAPPAPPDPPSLPLDGGKRRADPELRKEPRKDSLKSIEDVGYEEYVKRLQHKIQLISNARDSLEEKKSSKRKSSKGDLGVLDSQESPGADGKVPPAEPTPPPATATAGPVTSPEPPKSVEKKIEELAKERVKQKDIIHDLVMDKLQTKKQLNAEKRLNRSRNRTNVLCQVAANGASAGGGSLEAIVSPPAAEPRGRAFVGALTGPCATPSRAPPPPRTKHHPEPDVVNGTPAPPSRTPVTVRPTPAQQQPPRLQHATETPVGQLTEHLREEARSKARQMSNQDLGLSPEDRLLLLRKKYRIHMRELTDDSDDAKCTEQLLRTKLTNSKSFNDVSSCKQLAGGGGDSVERRRLSPPVPTTTAAAGGVGEPSKLIDYISDPNLAARSGVGATTDPSGGGGGGDGPRLRTRSKCKDRERRKSIIEKVSEFFNARKKDSTTSKEASPTKGRELTAAVDTATSSSGGGGGGFLRFKISPKLKDKSKSCFDVRSISCGSKEASPYGRSASEDCLNANGANLTTSTPVPAAAAAATTVCLSNGTSHNSFTPIGRKEAEELEPPPIPPPPLNYQRSDDEGGVSNEPRNEIKKQRAMSKASRQAELKRLRIAQEIQREQEEIEVKIEDLEAHGVAIEKDLRGEGEVAGKPNFGNLGMPNDEDLLKEWLEIMRNITDLKVRLDELSIRQQELQLEHRHAQLKEELNMRLSFGKLDKNSSDVAAEGAILNEMLEIVAKRQALRPSLDATVAAVSGPTAVGRAAHGTDVSTACVFSTFHPHPIPISALLPIWSLFALMTVTI